MRIFFSSENLINVVDTSDATQAPPDCPYDTTFDFESAAQLRCFQTIVSPAAGTITLSNHKKTVKYGSSSLKWETTGASKLQLKSPTFTIPNSCQGDGGVKVWIYKEAMSGKTLQVEFKYSSTTVGSFIANDFKGWRGIWVEFKECRAADNSLDSPTVIDEVNFMGNGAQTAFIDKLEFKCNIRKQSRDKVVPPISPFGLNCYDKSDFWQQTYRWSQQEIPASPSTIDVEKRNHLDHIKNRLKNWYSDETVTSPNYPSGSALEERWKTLKKSFNRAHDKYDDLTFDPVTKQIVGPPLFCRNCEPNVKFGDIMIKILLPLTLEYHLSSRTNEITAVATEQRSNINNAAIETLNRHRLSRINNLLDFARDQGFTDGSGLGSLDHEMNLDGAGFMHSLFLLSDSMCNPLNQSRLRDLIASAKWYNDFGEIYQTPSFELKGTTADRMITLMLYRLIIVLVMPTNTDDEIKAKIRDMDALSRWQNNTLSINEGLGGLIKPDYLVYHHKSFYGSAYGPPALHNAALVQYLQGGTKYALSSTSVNHIQGGLEALRLMAVKYSTPPSVSGRYPEYSNKVLVKNLPAYAYISVSYPSTLPTSVPTGISVSSLNNPEWFLRLYNDSTVNSYLEDGAPNKKKYYFNSLGSLQIMEAVKSSAVLQGKSQEQYLEGHWSKNFAALSIHRRKTWAVTVKGFNNFVWDYETSADENVLGLFASHGAVLIANDETSLQCHDIENGWDWSKIPGTTTIALGNPNIDDLNIGRTGRFYNKRKFSGGLTFKGTMTSKSGLFGMNFEQPEYDVSGWRGSITFRFKKSVFMFENLLVGLGSNIVLQNNNRKIAQTTLFQDKLSSSSFIKVDGTEKVASTDYSHNPSSSSSTTLTDAKGNLYYIPMNSSPMLKVTVATQTSKKEDGETSTSGRYGTAWFEHSSANPSYEYAVLIPTASYHAQLSDLKTAQDTENNEVYKVLRKNARAHVVQFLKSPKSWSTLSHPVTGYVMFRGESALPDDGPITAVTSGDCLLMAEETTQFIHLAITYPDLALSGAGSLTNSKDVGERLLYTSASTEKSISETLRNPVQTTIAETQVHGTPENYTPNVEISGQTIRFRNLKNGFTVEVKLTRITS
ncbi:Chondroitin sulfate ABC exolyase [Stylophora pistillata]|uniref:Chondroitin sulfate ABC exolyase n=1 Tax=Stylophora pistillata TaxID=50429 RepID=A0A2B4R7W5_STYPI|nr:Chondroitin sulfate ABC exolyase [Stylophora pistillata]